MTSCFSFWLRALATTFLSFYFISYAVSAERVTSDALAQIISLTNQIKAPGPRIVALSGSFVGTPYAPKTLIGGPDRPEQLVTDLTMFDCFTFLDTIEALRRTSSAKDFPDQLKEVRYRDAVVAYENRRHFFSDWVSGKDASLQDVTLAVSQGRALRVQKRLNLKSDGTLWVAGVAVTPREINYIPVSLIDAKLISALQGGDYIGVYSSVEGLDVSHTGLIVKKKGVVFLRHASSRHGINRVVDEELVDYLQSKSGLLVYRVAP